MIRDLPPDATRLEIEREIACGLQRMAPGWLARVFRRFVEWWG